MKSPRKKIFKKFLLDYLVVFVGAVGDVLEILCHLLCLLDAEIKILGLNYSFKSSSAVSLDVIE